MSLVRLSAWAWEGNPSLKLKAEEGKSVARKGRKAVVHDVPQPDQCRNDIWVSDLKQATVY